MSKLTTIGLDLAKRSFQVHGVDRRGKVILRKKLSRENVLAFFANLPPCLVGMEACGGAHHFAREIEKLGHTVRQMSPQYVKPYVKRDKNDANDAEAICEAVTRPNMRFVPTKSVEQQDILALHRIRERLVASRTAIANQARGLLLELGLIIPQGIRHVRAHLPRICEDLENYLTLIERDYLSDLYAELVELDEKVAKYDKLLLGVGKTSEECTRLMAIPGVGVLTATAVVAAVGEGKDFRNGREFSAWLGLVPRQHSTGGRQRLLGMSKRGDVYLRKLLMHGARSVVRHSKAKEDGRSLWLQGVATRRGAHRAIGAQANKTARIIWAVLAKGQEYKAAA